MNSQLLITKKEDAILTAWAENGRICQIQLESAKTESILDNIYVGKVKNIVKNINAAFVEFQKGQMGYLSLDEAVPIHTGGIRQDSSRVLIGDEIIVQVRKEAVKTKPPTLSGALELSGKYVVFCVGNGNICISHKIKNRETKMKLHDLLAAQKKKETYGFLARTNSADASEEEILREIHRLTARMEALIGNGMHREPFSCIYQAPPAYLGGIRDIYQSQIQEIVTDDDRIYQTVCGYLQENCWQETARTVKWDQENGKLDAVYNLSKTMEKALRERVWLKSGAYLIIQPTEALVSIDVNTGKAVSRKKNTQQHFKKVNLEAAAEIAVQLRLRNLSGIILVDFIDMAQEEDREELLAFLRRELGRDPVPARLVDMTKLGLVEITRKKVRKSLREQYQDCMGRTGNAGGAGLQKWR
ncbi:MAG: ribonuclease E/G [Clostridiaceae bacterium]|nr:ribonuclease E/G [Clostridiaceae bacterium]